MYSKIHVYYGDLGFRQYDKKLEKSVYIAFCDFGNVVALYWGMSIVSFLHVLYYLPRYLYQKWRFHRRRNQVHAVTVCGAIMVATVKVETKV